MRKYRLAKRANDDLIAIAQYGDGHFGLRSPTDTVTGSNNDFQYWQNSRSYEAKSQRTPSYSAL